MHPRISAYLYPRYFNGKSTTTKLSTVGLPAADVYSVKISPDGVLLAIGDDAGMLEIRMRSLRRQQWERIRLYDTGAAVRSLVWHTTTQNTILSGSANGNVYMTQISIKSSGGNHANTDIDDYDAVSYGEVPGFVHHLVMSEDGRKLIISYGLSIAIVNDPFRQTDSVGTLIALNVPQYALSGILKDYPIPRGIYFLDDDLILVVFLGQCGLIAYSHVTYKQVWTIDLRRNSLVGSSALSPSGERLAVRNMRNGIDWYSTSHKMYLCSTDISCESQLLVDIAFVDEETIVAGHTDGSIIFATFGFVNSTGSYNTGDYNSMPVQTLTYGVVDGSPLILVIARRKPAAMAYTRNAIMHVCQIENLPLYKAPSTPQHQIYGFSRRQLGAIFTVVLGILVSRFSRPWSVVVQSSPQACIPEIVYSIQVDTTTLLKTETLPITSTITTTTTASPTTVINTHSQTETTTLIKTETLPITSTITTTATTTASPTTIIKTYSQTETVVSTTTAKYPSETGAYCFCTLIGMVDSSQTPRLAL